MNPRIERLPHRDNRLHSDFLQRILKLPVDQLNAIAEVASSIAASLQRPLKTVEDRQKILDDIGRRKLAKILLLPHRAFACIIELRLQTRQTIKQRVAFGLEFFRFRRAPSSAAFHYRTEPRRRFSPRPSAAGSSRSRSCLHNVTSVFPFPLSHTAHYSDSFKSLSNSRAIYDTADIVC